MPQQSIAAPGRFLRVAIDSVRRVADYLERRTDAPTTIEPTVPAELLPLVGTVFQAIGAVGDPLLHTSSEESLRRVVDDFIADGRTLLWSGAVAEHMRRLSSATAREADAHIVDGESDFEDALVDSLGEAPADTFLKAMELASLTLEASARIPNIPSHLDAGRFIAPDRPASFLVEAPLPIARLWSARLRGIAALFGVFAGVAQHAHQPPWRARLLADLSLQGELAALTLLASLPGADVPVEVIPLDRRLDLPLILREHAESEARLEALTVAAAQSGLEIYPPIAGDD